MPLPDLTHLVRYDGSNKKSRCGVPMKVEKEKSVSVVMEEKSVGDELSMEEAHKLFSMVFGNDISKGILSQWSNQGIR